jgi:hypothetical protein
MYFPKFNMCTSLTEILHFPLSLFILTSLLRMFPLFFHAIYAGLCTSQIELVYFPSYFPLSYFRTFLYMILSFSNTIYGFVYFPKFNTCTSKTEISYFSLSLRVFPSFYRWFFYFSLQFMGDSYFRKSIFGLLSAKSPTLRAGENQSQLKHKYF